MWNTLLSGKTWNGHLVNRKKDGTFYKEEASISPVKDSAGAIMNFVAVKRDVTNELLIKQRLLQSQKMEAIGLLVLCNRNKFT
jgi:PAS domain S-box-containing protein